MWGFLPSLPPRRGGRGRGVAGGRARRGGCTGGGKLDHTKRGGGRCRGARYLSCDERRTWRGREYGRGTACGQRAVSVRSACGQRTPIYLLNSKRFPNGVQRRSSGRLADTQRALSVRLVSRLPL